MLIKKGLLFFTALAFLAFAGQVSAGPNANAVLSVDIDASDNKTDDGNTSGSAVAGTDIVVEVFVNGLAGPISGGVVTIDSDKVTVKSATAAAGFFALGTTSSTASIGAVPSGTLTNGYFATITLTPADGVTAGTEFTVGVSVNSLADAGGGTDDLTAAMPLSFNANPKVVASAPLVSVPEGGTGTATVTAMNFAADATITFAVDPADAVTSEQDGATLKLTASSPTKVTVTASDGTTTTDPVTIEFAEIKLPALDAVSDNMMDDGMVSASVGANVEIAVEVFAGDVEGGLGGASIMFAVEPADAATITGFTPAAGFELLDRSGNLVDIGAEQAVMLAAGGYVGTLTLMTGAEVVPFTVSVTSFRAVLASGEDDMLQLPAPVLYNHEPDLEVSPGLIVTIPRGDVAEVTITPVRFPEGATVTFNVEMLPGASGDDPISTLQQSEANGVLTLTVAGYVSVVVKVTATDGTTTVEKTIQFDEQVAVELSSFVGSVIEDRVVLNWETVSQTNNAGFRVLRSTDGETYEAVSELIAGAGTTDQVMDYMFEDTSLPAAEIVYYVLEQIDLDGTINRSNAIEVLLGARFTLPTEFASAVYPNPFNPRTTISYDLPSDATVSIVIYDAIGQEIRHLVSQHYTAGRYSVQWDAKDHLGRSVGSGVYIAKIVAGPNTAIQKMLLLK